MIEVSIREFTRAAKIVSAAVQRRATVPVLEAIKVRANGKLELEGTDLDMTARVRLPHAKGPVQEFLLNSPESLLAAIGAAGGSTVQFEPLGDAKGKVAFGYRAIAGALNRISAHGMAVEDFPTDRTGVADVQFEAEFSADVLRQIERIASAISKEPTRYYLNGISMRRLADTPDGWTWRFAATDGHRLLMCDIPLPGAMGDVKGDVILPARFMHAVFRHLRQCEGPLALKVGTSAVTNSTDSTAPEPAAKQNLASRASIAGRLGDSEVQFSTRLIDGTYPDISRIIPAETPQRAIMAVTELRRAVLAVAGSTRHSAAISLTFDQGGVVIGYAFDVEGVTAQYRIECDHNCRLGFSIGFRPSYVLDILNAITGDQVAFGFDGGDAANGAPTAVRDLADPAFLAVLMPMRL